MSTNEIVSIDEFRGLDKILTRHARMRMNQRGLTHRAVQAVLDHGEISYSRKAIIYSIGRKEVTSGKRFGVDLSDYEGIQVTCSRDGQILTVYRNRDFRRLRRRRLPFVCIRNTPDEAA